MLVVKYLREKNGTLLYKMALLQLYFFAALDEYNMESNEEQGTTKMEVSLRVYKEVVNDTKNFQCCNILFLNKIDLFREKITSKIGRKEFEDKFQDFNSYLKKGFKEFLKVNEDIKNLVKDDENEKVYQAGIAYIREKFKNSIDDKVRSESVVMYSTCAIEALTMSNIFNAMKDFIFLKRLNDSDIHF